jgi:hypothetical protein
MLGSCVSDDRHAAGPLTRALAVSGVVCLLWQLAVAPTLSARETPEYRLKAAVLYNFAQFTDWPANTGPTLKLCIPWQDPFGKAIDTLQDKAVGERHITILRGASIASLKECNLVFIPASAIGDLPQILNDLGHSPVLTVAESPGAARRGVALNLGVSQNRITFEANLKAARAVGLELEPALLRLATEVFQ